MDNLILENPLYLIPWLGQGWWFLIYPGTTVEITKAKKVFDNTEISFFDTPGIYSLSDRSEEEKITEKILFEMNPDRVIIMADTVSLERSLYITLQILEAKIPAVIALNFIEETERN